MGIRSLWFVAVGAALVSFLVAYWVKPTPENEWLHILLISLWTLGPPTWLLTGAAFGIRRPPLSEQEKFFHDSAGKFWAGVLALLLAIYTRDKWVEQPPKESSPKSVPASANP